MRYEPVKKGLKIIVKPSEKIKTHPACKPLAVLGFIASNTANKFSKLINRLKDWLVKLHPSCNPPNLASERIFLKMKRQPTPLIRRLLLAFFSYHSTTCILWVSQRALGIVCIFLWSMLLRCHCGLRLNQKQYTVYDGASTKWHFNSYIWSRAKNIEHRAGIVSVLPRSSCFYPLLLLS